MRSQEQGQGGGGLGSEVTDEISAGNMGCMRYQVILEAGASVVKGEPCWAGLWVGKVILQGSQGLVCRPYCMFGTKGEEGRQDLPGPDDRVQT